MRGGTRWFGVVVFVASSALAHGQCETWASNFGLSPGDGADGAITSLLTFNDGSGDAMYAVGSFSSVGGIGASHVARWDGTSWSALGTGLTVASALTVFDDGTGLKLFASGRPAGGSPLCRLARWNGTTWTAIEGGVATSVFGLLGDSGTLGSYLYRCGSESIVAPSRPTVERWDGSAWTEVGPQFTGVNVRAMAVFDDGSGPELYVGGAFDGVGSLITNSIARWNGSSWSDVGGGLNHNSAVFAMAVYDDGSGPALYVGGSFGSAGSVFTPSLAKWKGGQWHAVTSSSAKFNGAVYSLAVHDDVGPSGPALYAGGVFTEAPGTRTSDVARYDGQSWSPLGLGVEGRNPHYVQALASFDDGSGPRLMVGGQFATAGGHASSNIAQWWGCFDRVRTYCAGDGSVLPCPCGNNGATAAGCANSMFAQGSLLSPAGTPSVVSDSFSLNASRLTGSVAIFFQALEQGPASVVDDGIGCIGTGVTRLGTKATLGSSAKFPTTGDPLLSVRGNVPAAGGTRFYQCFYRNATSAFCPPATSNRTNGLAVTWVP